MNISNPSAITAEGFFHSSEREYTTYSPGCGILKNTDYKDQLSTGAAAGSCIRRYKMRKDGFYMPARVICGDDAVRKHAKEIGKYGSKALIVTGRHSADACGVYEDICAALEEDTGNPKSAYLMMVFLLSRSAREAIRVLYAPLRL